MAWWQALILGLVEGLTEYLPVSSTGHLILTAWLLGLARDAERWKAVFVFNIVIQAGAIAAVLVLYRRRVMQMMLGLAGRDVQGRRLALHLLLAFLPAAVLGPMLDQHIERHLNGPWPVAGALFVGAWLMLAVAKSQAVGSRGGGAAEDALNSKLGGGGGLAEEGGADASAPFGVGRGLEGLDWRMALMIGFGQCIAMWPGTSRSMMTIVAAMMLGLRARDAAEFSFLLGLITLSAATAYKAMRGGADMVHELGWLNIGIGFVAATIAAALAVKWFVGFLTRHGLAPFGWYRLALAIVLALLLWSGVLVAP